MAIDSAKLDELEKAAEAAKHEVKWKGGEWIASQYLDTDEWGILNGANDIVVRLSSGITETVAHHIAAASPDTILEMVRELRIRGRVIELASVELFEPKLTLRAWRAQAERELGEK